MEDSRNAVIVGASEQINSFYFNEIDFDRKRSSAERIAARIERVRKSVVKHNVGVIVACVTYNGIECGALVDTGASANFIDSRFVVANSHKFKPKPFKSNLLIGNAVRVECDEMLKDVKVVLQARTFVTSFIIVDKLNFDSVLGTRFLSDSGCVVDVRANMLVFSDTNKVLYQRDDINNRVVNAVEQKVARPSLLLPANSTTEHHDDVSSNNALIERFDQMMSCITSYVADAMTKSADGTEYIVLNVMQRDLMTAVEDKHVKYTKIDDISNDKARHLIKQFSDVFPDELPGLPPTRDVEFGIQLIDNSKPPSHPPRKMSGHELAELNKIVADLLAKGLIRPSTSPYGAPVVLVKKKDGGYRLTLDVTAPCSYCIHFVLCVQLCSSFMHFVSHCFSLDSQT